MLLPGRLLERTGDHEVAFTDSLRINGHGRFDANPSWPQSPFDDPDVVVVGITDRPGTAEFIRRARGGGQVVVADVDNWVWDLPWHEADPLTGASLVGYSFPVWRTVLGAVDLVTTSSRWMADELAQWPDVAPVTWLPNILDLDAYGPPEDVTDGPVIGYSGSLRKGHGADVAEVLGPWLGTFVEKHDLRVMHFGHHPEGPTFARLAGIDPGRVMCRHQVDVARYASSRPMRGMDIGLVPLVDRPYNAARSCLKGLEYAAAGVPFVASASPAYIDLGEGLLAGQSLEEQSPDAWRIALERLLDPTERVCLRESQFQYVRQAVECAAHRWDAAYSRARP